MPWLNKFIARVTMQTLPVRSPLPNRHPSDAVGVDVRCRHLHGRRKVEHHLAARHRAPHVHHGLTDLDGVVEFGAGERL
jgi:hypothetical protein